MPVSGAPLDRPVDVTDLLRRGLDGRPDAPALVSRESRFTWRELHEASDRLAANLLGLGLKPRDRVASLMPNRCELDLHYIACVKAGLVATPLNYRYTAPEIDHALEVSGASLLIAHAERDRDLAASKLVGRLPRGVIRYGAKDRQGPSFESLVEREPAVRQLPRPDPSAPAFIFFTSGSTGPAKGVTHSLETIGWIVGSKMAGLSYTPDDAFLTGSSLSHAGGVGFTFAALAAGARVVVARTLDPSELLSLLREESPTVIWTLPALLIRLVRDHGAVGSDFSSLRVCSTGGDKASPELEREFAELTGFPIRECYGMTETGCTTMTPPTGVNKPGSIGLLSPGYTLSIRSESGAELPHGAEGRMWISFPGNFIGYWNAPEATAETFRDAWLDTGDVMKVDADGYVWFCGRLKQIIVHDGSNISPQEVEGALLEHPAVESAGVIGVHDVIHGENVYAYVTLRDSASRPTVQELIEFARTRVGYKAPEMIFVLDEMPLNPVGKVDRTELKRMAAERCNGVMI
ncbi:MAG TPA: class I adenylate-forming enzyme family protein [Candidatus Binatia bacterium]|nr:class I adenylate-forming enzyme family protein [Candidatus Binatia bacterium]